MSHPLSVVASHRQRERPEAPSMLGLFSGVKRGLTVWGMADDQPRGADEQPR
jgi:hypothetical protein